MRIRVNPVQDEDGNYLKAFDHIGREIKYKPEGNEVTKNTRVSRAIKNGDLVVVKVVKKAEIKKNTGGTNSAPKDKGVKHDRGTE